MFISRRVFRVDMGAPFDRREMYVPVNASFCRFIVRIDNQLVIPSVECVVLEYVIFKQVYVRLPERAYKQVSSVARSS